MSILDHPAISGCYLFPQPRLVADPFHVEVDGAQLACYRRTIDPGGYTVVHFHDHVKSVIRNELQQLGPRDFRELLEAILMKLKPVLDTSPNRERKTR